MRIERTIPLLTLLMLTGVIAALAPASSGSTQASLAIRHQTRGCHAWSLNRGAYQASQTIVVRRGGSVSVTNNDVMPHKLIKTSGPAVTYTRLSAGGMMGLKGTFSPAVLAHMSASSRITFATAGTYRFTTKAGEDYMPGIKTVGDDNVLRLVVRVG